MDVAVQANAALLAPSKMAIDLAGMLAVETPALATAIENTILDHLNTFLEGVCTRLWQLEAAALWRRDIDWRLKVFGTERARHQI